MSDCCSDAGFFASLEGFELLPHIVRLLARSGGPIAVEDVAHVAGQPVERVVEVLRSQAGTDWADEGRLAGLGLTSRTTANGFHVDGRDLYTWCATDTLLFTLILGRATVASSTCPATGATIRVELGPDGIQSVTPAAAVVSQRRRPDALTDVRADVCDHGSFFASSDAARDWAGAHPDGEVLSVADAFDRCRVACEELGWLSAAAPTPAD